jgi:hypothetical protein
LLTADHRLPNALTGLLTSDQSRSVQWPMPSSQIVLGPTRSPSPVPLTTYKIPGAIACGVGLLAAAQSAKAAAEKRTVTNESRIGYGDTGPHLLLIKCDPQHGR